MASHIKPYSVCCSKKESFETDNGLLLCPLHDALFDRGYITFDNEGNIVISKKIEEIGCEKFNIQSIKKIEMSEKKKKYMEFHRRLYLGNFKEK